MKNGVSIEDFNGSVKIDFANKYIGGGALKHGMVQEEIMFLCHPELYITMLICPKIEKHEAIGLIGFRKFFKSIGYSHTTKFAGPEKSDYAFD
jgi:poly(ADP-ribose) glycohydrolase